jgi:hypothetical protein
MVITQHFMINVDNLKKKWPYNLITEEIDSHVYETLNSVANELV